MSNVCLGKEVNKTLIQELEEYVKSKQVKEDTISDPDQFYRTDFKDDQGKDIYIFADKAGEPPKYYELLCKLLSHINFEQHPAENVYEIPGMKMPATNNKDRIVLHTIYITKDSAEEISKISSELKSELKIEFPDELFQLAHKNIIPGIGYQAPEPKKYSETEEEYEARMEQHYKDNGVEKEATENGYRKPYLHELVRYTKEKAEITTEPRQSYYERNQRTLPPEVAEQGGPGVDPGERKKVVDTDKTLGQKLRDKFISLKGIKGSGNALKAAVGTAAAGLLVYGGIVAFPASMAGLAITAAVAVPSGIVLGNFIKKNKDKWKKGIKDWWNNFTRGSRIKEGNEGPGQSEQQPKPKQPGKGQGQGQGPNSPDKGSNVPQSIEALFTELGVDIRDLDELSTRIAMLKEQYENEPDNDKKVALSQQITVLVDQQRQYYENMFNVLKQFIYSNTKKTGGPKL